LLKSFLTVALAVSVLAGPVRAAEKEIVGKAVALDGATLRVTPDGAKKPVTVRISAVEAPEMSVWPWGPRARGTLDLFLRNYDSRVACTPKGQDELMLVGQCRMVADNREQELDVGAIMVRSGYAVENRAVGGGVYSKAEVDAWRNNLGVWAKFWAK
jgi:endonuclease YncB( thermonuclease family)